MRKNQTHTNDLIIAAEAMGATVINTSAATIIIVTKEQRPERMTKKQVAAYSGCTERAVGEAARSGALIGSEISERALSFLRSDVDAWLASKPIRVRVVDVDQDDEDDLAKRLGEAAE